MRILRFWFLSWAFSLTLLILVGGTGMGQELDYPALTTPNVFTNANQFQNGVQLGLVTLARLPNPPIFGSGTLMWCTDCTPNSNPCVGVGAGTWATYTGGVWNCGTNSGGLTIPILFPASVPASFANECASIANSSGGTTATSVMMQVLDTGTNIAHDFLCRASNGALIFPLAGTWGYSFGAGLPSGIRSFEVNSSQPAGRNGLTLSNLASSGSRGNSVLWRSCFGGCGTDFNLFEDGDLNGSEDISWVQGTNITNLYFTGNCPLGCAMKFGPSNGTVGIKQFFISDSTTDARTHPEFGLVNGHLAHDIVNTTNLDNWGTLALTGGSATYNFAVAWRAAPLCSCNNPNQTGAPIACSASATTTVLTVKSGAGTDTINYLCMGNPY